MVDSNDRGTPLLDVTGLTVDIRAGDGLTRIVRGIDLTVTRGHTVALVGESGSGKTLSMMAMLDLHPGAVDYRVTGSVRFEGQEILGASEARMARIRGGRIGVIFQDPLASLNPLRNVGDQIAEAARIHLHLSASQARARAVELLSYVGIPAADRRSRDHPHQFSGGMRQRVMIAMALAAEPDLLIADEPTTALDVTIQAQILELLARLHKEAGMSMIFITHDLGIVARIAETMAVMYAGRIVERGPVDVVMTRPDHPYTAGLLRSVPRIDGPRTERLESIPGTPPARIGDLVGCAFAPRCTYAEATCRELDPPPVVIAPGHESSCLVRPFAPTPTTVA